MSVAMMGAFVMFLFFAKELWVQGKSGAVIFAAFTEISIILYIMSEFVIICKTIKMDENGCTIKILNYERFYKWDDFAVKRKEGKNWFIVHPSRYGSGYVPRKGVFFALRYMDKIEYKNPHSFNLFHPFSCFYIYLIDDMKEHGREKSLQVFCEADEQEFLQNMEKWGVELEEDL